MNKTLFKKMLNKTGNSKLHKPGQKSWGEGGGESRFKRHFKRKKRCQK